VRAFISRAAFFIERPAATTNYIGGCFFVGKNNVLPQLAERYFGSILYPVDRLLKVVIY